MPQITLSPLPEPITEGQHTFTITDVDYKEDFGKLILFMRAETGETHQEKYSLIRDDGSLNDGALNSFSYFVRSITNSNATTIDPLDLKGIKFVAQVSHDVQPRRDNPTETYTFIRLSNYEKVNEIEDDDLPF